MSTLTVRQTFALVVLFVVTSLTFIQLDNRRALDPLKEGLSAAVSPVTSAFSEVADGPGGPSALEQELAQVKAERDALLAENVQLKADAREIDQLRSQLAVQQEFPAWELLPARVTNTDPTNNDKFIIIDKGSADGVQVGMAVAAQGKNYIGQVTEVEEHRARVALIIDRSQRVGARLDGGADGIIYGMWQNGGRLELRHLDREVQPGATELVLTADNEEVRTSRVPGGLIIGRINGDPEKNRQGDTLSVPVLPLVDFESLRVVTVILADAP